MNALFDPFTRMDEDTRALVVMTIFGVVAGVFAMAFVVGGLWALRGRAALATPRCRRCRSALRGEGRSLPARCQECGAALTTPMAVTWLRFRKQPLTFAITGPVVAIGGLALALLVAIRLTNEFFRAVSWRAAELRYIADQEAMRAGTPVPLPPVQQEKDTVKQMIERVRSGGADGAAALAELAQGQRIELGNSWGYRPWALLSWADAMRSLVEDLARGTAPTTPFEATPLSSRGFHLRGDEVKQLTNSVACALVAQNLATPAWADATIGPLPPMECRIPARVHPKSTVVSTFDRDGDVNAQSTVVDDIRVDGVSSVSGPRGGWGLYAQFTAPAELGAHAVEIDWHSGFYASGNIGLVAAHRETTRLSLEVVDGPELVDVTTDPQLDPMVLPGFMLRAVIERLAERDMITLGVWTHGSIALNGRWEVLLDDGWTTIGTQTLATCIYGDASKLVPRPAKEWGETIRARYVPDRTPTQFVLGGEPSTIRTIPGSPAALIGRSLTGVWLEPREFVLRRVERMSPFEGSKNAIVFRAERAPR